jgi:hypothetical protein
VAPESDDTATEEEHTVAIAPPESLRRRKDRESLSIEHIQTLNTSQWLHGRNTEMMGGRGEMVGSQASYSYFVSLTATLYSYL